MASRISSFTNIPIDCSTLVICDIDDTVLHFPTMEADCSAAAAKGSSFTDNDPAFTSKEREDHIRQLIRVYCCIKEPDHTDSAGFDDFMRRLDEHGGHLVFLTARSKSDEEFTRKHLRAVGIDDAKFQIYFTDNAISKGEFILSRFDSLGLPLNQWKSVVFIDDRLDNIRSVEQLCPGIKCYQFCV
jgi:hypothetical protein